MDQFLGQIQTFGFNFPPIGWMHCNGALLSISENDALFALLGTTFGGDGQSTFALPDLRGRSMIHQGQGQGLSNFVMGQAAGVESVTLLVSNMAPHNHGISINVSEADAEAPEPTKIIAKKTKGFAEDQSGTSVLGGVSQLSIGSNIPFEIRNPYTGIYHGIAIQGIFPSRN